MFDVFPLTQNEVSAVIFYAKIKLVAADKGSLINLTSVIQYVLKLSDLH